MTCTRSRRLAASAAAALVGACCVTPPAAAEVKLANGDSIEGEIVSEGGTDPDGNPVVTIDHPAMGLVTVPADAIAPADEGPDEDPDGAFVDTANAMTQTIDRFLFPGWDKSFAAGFNGSQGNTETLSFYANFETGIEDERRRWDIQADYFRGTENGEATENNLIARAERDWLIPGKDHFYFARGTFEYDQFEGYEQRVGLYGGVGYQFIETDRHSLLGRVGVGAVYEFGGAENYVTEGLIGLEYAYQITGNQRFEFRNTFYPALDPFFGEYRNVTEANHKISIAAGDGLSLKLGVYNEYDSEVTENSENNSFKYFGALVYDF